MTQKVMVIDDEVDLVQLYKMVLKMAGYNVAGATSGRRALSEISDYLPDLILLDVMMPEISGIDVCQKIRKMELEKQPIIFMYSANDSLDNRDRCLEAGANKLISKVVPMDEVTDQIKAALPA
ncbi:MAG: response regulator [Chloroflexota bacterium]